MFWHPGVVSHSRKQSGKKETGRFKFSRLVHKVKKKNTNITHVLQPASPRTTAKMEQNVEDSYTAEQRQRLDDLSLKLTAGGVELRRDSSLCWNYILRGEGQVDTIVLKMQQARYLHEYCDFAEGHRQAVRLAQVYNVVLSRTQWLAFVQQCVLKTTASGEFPVEWPWQH